MATTVSILPAPPAEPLVGDNLARWADDALTLLAFRAWVADRLTASDTSIVGTCAIPSLCPIASYLYSIAPSFVVNVYATSVIIYPRDGGQVDVPLPSWAMRFIRDVDRLVDICPSVTAAQALRILDRIEREDAVLAAVLGGRNV